MSGDIDRWVLDRGMPGICDIDRWVLDRGMSGSGDMESSGVGCVMAPSTGGRPYSKSPMHDLYFEIKHFGILDLHLLSVLLFRL